ncbi:hypothetical protein [Maribellus sp. YY47]|uniref:hypothetical protein n=1 Tax=Maribellus sp. YY47 TaxID=2929486 RepID=UPI00200187E1|nr:hypothetical protein [Maribellus sp. YY47]MCK3684232.1 hypothetical protein [Maribellus sp. YY47]
MKNSILFLVSLIFLSGCVSKTSYTDLENKCKSMTEEITKLKAQIDELENGEERIVNLAKNSIDDGKYLLADKYIKQLSDKHPESKEIAYFKKLQPTIDKKIEEELAIKEKARQDSIKLANINNLGSWDIGYYVDDFGERTGEFFVSMFVNGTFSNSATTNSDLKVRFMIDKNSSRIQLYEYARDHPVKGEGFIYFKIRDKNNKEFEIRAYNSDHGNTTIEDEYDKKLRNILLNGGEIKFVAEADKYGSPSTYKFAIDNADWFENAITKMKLKNEEKK